MNSLTRYLTLDTPSTVFPTLGVALASLLFLFTFTVTDATLEQAKTAFAPLGVEYAHVAENVTTAVNTTQEAVYATLVASDVIAYEQSTYYVPSEPSSLVAGAYTDTALDYAAYQDSISTPWHLLYSWFSGE